MDETRQLYIISGCNGAGKTTASYTVLPEILLCKEFVNADEIAKGLSPFNPESMAIEAGRLMLKRIDELLATRTSFSIETTLATRSYTRLITRAQSAGYKVSLIYFWLNSPELAVNRVLQRVNEGGHNVPIDTIYRRYQAGINNLFRIYAPRVDYWLLADNSVSPRVIVAEGCQVRTGYTNLNFLIASRVMSNNEMQELSDKLRRGLQLAEQRLLERNARHGKLLSQGTPDGKVIYVSATELLERLQKQEKEKSKESEKE